MKKYLNLVHYKSKEDLFILQVDALPSYQEGQTIQIRSSIPPGGNFEIISVKHIVAETLRRPCGLQEVTLYVRPLLLQNPK